MANGQSIPLPCNYILSLKNPVCILLLQNMGGKLAESNLGMVL